jgi:hypothetical protein
MGEWSQDGDVENNEKKTLPERPSGATGSSTPSIQVSKIRSRNPDPELLTPLDPGISFLRNPDPVSICLDSIFWV